MMNMARRVVALASPGDCAMLDAREPVEWLTKLVVDNWSKGDYGFVPPPAADHAAVAPPAPPVKEELKGHRLKGRALDRYLKHHRGRLKAAVGDLPSEERERALRKAGNDEFKALGEDEKQPWLEAAKIARLPDAAAADAAVAEVAAVPACKPPCSKRQLQALGTVLVDLIRGDVDSSDAHTMQLRRHARVIAATAFSKKAIGAGSPTLRKRLGIGRRMAETGGRPKAKVIKHGCKLKRGRPQKISDLELKAQLLPLSKASCRFKRSGEAVNTIPSSWRRTHMRTASIKTKLSYRQLLRRIRRARLAIVVGKKRTDRCPICMVWDRQVQPLIQRTLGEIRETLQGSLKEYWTQFDRQLLTKWWASEDDFERESCPHYVKMVRDFIEGHDTDFMHMRLALDAEGLVQLASKETVAQHALDGIEPLVKEWSGHFQLRNSFDDTLRRQLAAPPCGVLCLWMDYQVNKEHIKYKFEPPTFKKIAGNYVNRRKFL
jgi:hypothetical protein